MVKYLEQNAGQYHTIKRGDKSLEAVEQFKYLGTIVTIRIAFMKKLRVDLT
jgi:hypothetical protein